MAVLRLGKSATSCLIESATTTVDVTYPRARVKGVHFEEME